MTVHRYILATPQAVEEGSEDRSWRYFQGCLGALDGTYIQMQVPALDKPRYRSRKGDIATNILGVCDKNERFVYVLSGWEGSATDGRVLKDAISRENGLKVPIGSYYLCDSGYTNGKGFLAPYCGYRYHLREWEAGHRVAQNYQEHFNMKHAKARNVIERVFGQLKSRWAILRSNSYYPVQTQNMIIMACTYLHNFIKDNMEYDPVLDDEEYIIQLEQPHVVSKERRTWTRAEDDALIVILKKIVVDGMRQENTFRTGYLERIEKELQVRFSGTDLTSTNAISKLTVHLGVKSLRFKSFPYFKDWIEIFGKDRATGKNAQGPKDLAKAANEEPYIPHFDVDEFPLNHNIHVQGNFNSNHHEHVDNKFSREDVPVADDIVHDTPSPGECNSNSVNMKKRDYGKKIPSTRKRSWLDSASKEPIIVDLMDAFFKQQNESISVLVDKLDKRGENPTNNKPEVVDKTKHVLEALRILLLRKLGCIWLTKLRQMQVLWTYFLTSLKMNKSHS
ncbi:hypothetical protein C2S52_014940 [Perilla frutescens var. hirtella]|nr:hypothetical protein C2S52_014940 [Perilla frutescens var. hirtella]